MWNIVPKKVELFYEKKNKNEENSVGFKREEKRNQKRADILMLCPV